MTTITIFSFKIASSYGNVDQMIIWVQHFLGIDRKIYFSVSCHASRWLGKTTCERRVRTYVGRWIHRSIRFEKLKAHLHVLIPWSESGGEPAKKGIKEGGIPGRVPRVRKSWQRWRLIRTPRGRARLERDYPGTRRMRIRQIVCPRVHGCFPSSNGSWHSCRLSLSYI